MNKFAVRKFDSWDEAVAFYTKEFEAHTCSVMKYVGFGAANNPIDLQSTHPTPSAPKVAPSTAGGQPPQIAQPSRARDAPAVAVAAPPPLQRQAANPPAPSAAQIEHPGIVYVGSDSSASLSSISQPRAPPTTPTARVAKRPFPMLVGDQPEVSDKRSRMDRIDLAPRADKGSKISRGSPIPRGVRRNTPAQKARDISAAPPAEDSDNAKDLYVPDNMDIRTFYSTVAATAPVKGASKAVDATAPVKGSSNPVFTSAKALLYGAASTSASTSASISASTSASTSRSASGPTPPSPLPPSSPLSVFDSDSPQEEEEEDLPLYINDRSRSKGKSVA